MEPAAPSTFKRYILPLALLVAVVGGLAFALQYLPSWKTGPAPKAGVKFDPLCKFLMGRPIWDPKNPAYALEVEKGNPGFYDFPFENPSEEPGQMGLVSANCACSSIQVCFPGEEAWARLVESRKAMKVENLDEAGGVAWTRVVKEGTAPESVTSPHPVKTAVDVPAKTKGIVRVGWDGRGTPGSVSNLQIEIWHKARNDAVGYKTGLEVPLAMRSPLQFYPARINLDPIGPKDSASGEFVVWSATRPKLDLEIKGEGPLFVVERRPLSPEEIETEQEKLAKRDDIHTRIKVAWAVKATVREQALEDGVLHQHDLGHFVRPLVIKVDDEVLESPPIVAGRIRTEIEIGGLKSDGKIDLGIFSAERGATAKAVLWSGPGVKLEYAHAEPKERLHGKLTFLENDAAKRNKWQMEVRVPPGGTFPEKAAIYLRIEGSTRQVRIPVIGTAGR